MSPEDPKKGLTPLIMTVTQDGLHYPERSLLATIDGQHVGTLHEYRNLWRFQYTATWCEHPEGFDISPWLPRREENIADGSTSRPVQWYFDNLLPEEHQRIRMADDAQVAGSDNFALLAHYGKEFAGSLTLLAPGESLAHGHRLPLTDPDLSHRIGNLPRLSLAAGAEKRMSLAGAQHKLAVIEDDGALYQPVGTETSTHILKPDSTDAAYPHTVVNEYFTMRLAKAMGLITANVQRRYVPDPVFLVERFDRQATGRHVVRRHAIDACQLLNLDAGSKYTAGSIKALAQIVQHCREKLSTRRRLFDWLIFNVLVGNDDAHLKNLSFLVDCNGMDLAPHYDLLSTVAGKTQAYTQPHATWPQASTLAWDILGVKRFVDITPSVLVAAADALGLPERMAARRVAELATLAVTEAEMLYGTIERENEQWAQVAGVTLDGEMRLLRTIIHTVIRDMATQLG